MTSAEMLALKNARLALRDELMSRPATKALDSLLRVTESLLAWRDNISGDLLDEHQLCTVIKDAIRKSGLSLNRWTQAKGVKSAHALSNVFNGRALPTEQHAEVVGYRRVTRYQRLKREVAKAEAVLDEIAA